MSVQPKIIVGTFIDGEKPHSDKPTYQDLASRFANCATILLTVYRIGLSENARRRVD